MSQLTAADLNPLMHGLDKHQDGQREEGRASARQLTRGRWPHGTFVWGTKG